MECIEQIETGRQEGSNELMKIINKLKNYLIVLPF